MRQEKQFLLDEVRGHITKSDSFLIMRYKGLTANKANEFRGDISKKGEQLKLCESAYWLKLLKPLA